MRKNEKITALYERLSRDDFGKDDDQQRESNSISNQKAMLEEFAARQGFTNIVHFTDDGISGTCFDRPGFLAMMKEVEAGNVEYLCIKDMSRMGRDYLKVGQIMEILRQRGVRLIAINDGVDSARGDDDFMKKLSDEYDELEQAHETTYGEFKTVRDDLHRLWKVKSCVDTAARFNERTEEQMHQNRPQTRHKKEDISR